MAVSFGIDYTPGQWQVCRVEQGKLTEHRMFEGASELLAELLAELERYPAATIVVSLDVATPFAPLPELSDEQLERLVQRYHPTPAFREVIETLRAVRALSSRCYCAPSVEYLPTVPLHRFLMRPALGSAREVCAVVALLHYMREQQATWEEMNFFCVNASENGTSVLVIANGQIVNGINTLQGSAVPVAYGYLASLELAGEHMDLQPALEEAFWEGLAQDLAGLLAIHHSEDLVVLGKQGEKLVERLSDTYQIYLFPHAHTEREGYEAALGAALLGDGLVQDGSASEVVERLQIRQAQRRRLAPDF
ncbi:MAG TPA: DUF1464 family protein [Ktedonobacteraceae bacterium]